MRAELETLQQIFSDALLNIEDVEPALATFKGDAKLNRERLAIYRGNLIAIWQQTCANAYPVLKQLVGEDFFNDLARVYGYTHASQSGDITHFAASLPSYLRTLEHCRAYPYLSDVAQLEWQVHCAYYLAQRPPVTLAQLGAIPSDQLDQLRFKLQATCFLFQSPWAVTDIWQAHQKAPVEFPQQLSKTTHCLIWRELGVSQWKIQVHSISAATYAALQSLANGDTFDQALEFAFARDPQFALQAELADWFNKQLFYEITPFST